MTTEAQKANLARIRDNQRRSRARRKEYLQELEQRLRAYELQGIEASAEVQVAARRVADENRRLRELLHSYGASEEYIAQYLQTSASNNVDSSHSHGQHPQAIAPRMAQQSLQQLLLPRQAAHLQTDLQLTLPSQSSREPSIASATTTSSSVWESSQSTMPSYSHDSQQLGVSPSSIASSDQHHYSPSLFHAHLESSWGDQLSNLSPGDMMNDPQQSLTTSRPIPSNNRAAVNYQVQMNSLHDPGHRYNPLGGY